MRLDICAFALVITAGSLSAANPPVPALFQDLYTTLNTQLSGFEQALVKSGWTGTKSPYLNSAQFLAANSDLYTQLLTPNYYANVVTVQLNELQALGVNAVTVHINFPILDQDFYTFAGNPSQYAQFVSFYQQVAQDVHNRGMKLIVEASLGVPGAGTNMNEFLAYIATLSWTDYMAGRAADALAVAELIEPDYMTVMTEPDTEAGVSGQANVNTPTGATQLVQTVLTALQGAGIKNIQIGAGAGTWIINYMQYVTAFAALPIDFVDMHIYILNDSYFTAALTAADAIHAAGKQVAMSECWAEKVRDTEIGILPLDTLYARDPFSFWEPVDEGFFKAIVNLANAKQFAFISPYWTYFFFSYLDYSVYGLLDPDTVLTDAIAASFTATQTGVFSPPGHYWESLNIPADTTPPATPAAPTAPVIGSTGANIQWVADTDNVGVSAYKLIRNGVVITTINGFFYNDTGLTSGQTYSYKLKAVDAAGNLSAASAALLVTTLVTTPPSVPQNLTITNVTPTTITLSWSLSTGVGGVQGYRILKGNTSGSEVAFINVTKPPYTAIVSPLTTYFFEVESYNAEQYTSAPSNEVSAKTPTILPSVPQNLTITNVTATSITLKWDPSTGPNGVAGYLIMRGNTSGSETIRATATAPPFTAAVAPSTTYYFEVVAYDSVGRRSAASNEVMAITPAH